MTIEVRYHITVFSLLFKHERIVYIRKLSVPHLFLEDKKARKIFFRYLDFRVDIIYLMIDIRDHITILGILFKHYRIVYLSIIAELKHA